VDQDPLVRARPSGAQGVRIPSGSGRVAGGALFRTTLVLATSVVLLFLLLPIAAVFLQVPPGELVSALGSDPARDALRVTAETISISMLVILVFGTPAVAGIGLLVAFGRLGLLGGTFDALGIDVAFTKAAVVLAVTFVASPFYLRTAIASFEVVDPTL